MSVTMHLHDSLQSYFSSEQPLFNQLMALSGECFRHQKGRFTQRIILGTKTYFIKKHTGVGWREIFKNLLQGRWPVLSAKNEWQALQCLKAQGLAVPEVMGYGLQGNNPAHLQSFVLLEDVTPTLSLEELSVEAPHVPLILKRQLINVVATITRTMHAAGINHRDLYICHFLLDKRSIGTEKLKLYLIDLHRAQMRQTVPLRWRVKDLAGLYFSSKESGLTSRDYLRFIRAYTGKSLQSIFNEKNHYWKKVKIRGEQLYRDHCK